MVFGLALLLGVAGLAGVERTPDEVLALLRQRILDEAARVPNYTCVQTIDRQFFVSTGQRSTASCVGPRVEQNRPGNGIAFYGSDRFRLDVGVGRTGEVYSWAGAERFDDRDLGDFIPGPASTGAFASLLHMMFGLDAAEFLYRGKQTLERRRLLAYSFRVPAARSHYSMRVAHGPRRIVAYHGTLLADPETSDLVRLDVQIDDPGLDAGLCEFSASQDYGRTPIGAADFLLPKAARQRFVLPGGWETENTVAFSACREFKAESTVQYEDPAPAQPAGGKGAAAREPLKSSPGMPVSVALTTTIDSDTAAAGDVYAGRLAEPLQDQSGNMLAPRGTTVQGRIMRVERYQYPSSVQFALTLETVEIGGAPLPLHVVPAKSGPAGGALKARPTERVMLPHSPATDYLVIQHSSDRWIVPPGYRMEWVTAAP